MSQLDQKRRELRARHDAENAPRKPGVGWFHTRTIALIPGDGWQAVFVRDDLDDDVDLEDDLGSILEFRPVIAWATQLQWFSKYRGHPEPGENAPTALSSYERPRRFWRR